jgi:hypothetical protein
MQRSETEHGGAVIRLATARTADKAPTVRDPGNGGPNLADVVDLIERSADAQGAMIGLLQTMQATDARNSEQLQRLTAAVEAILVVQRELVTGQQGIVARLDGRPVP